jgi:hypothetical protein
MPISEDVVTVASGFAGAGCESTLNIVTTGEFAGGQICGVTPGGTKAAFGNMLSVGDA